MFFYYFIINFALLWSRIVRLSEEKYNVKCIFILKNYISNIEVTKIYEFRENPIVKNC